MDHINFCSSCCPTTTKKDLSTTTANESSAMKDEANGSSTTTPDKPKESPVQIPHFKKKSKLEGFLKECKKKPTQLIVLNFTTTWCEPCINAEKPSKNLAKKFRDVKFANVDVDHFLDLVNYLEVVKMPTFLLMKPSQSSTKNVPKGNNANGVEGNMGKEDASEGSGKKKAEYYYKKKQSQIDNFKEIDDRVVGLRKDLEELANKITEHRRRIEQHTP